MNFIILNILIVLNILQVFCVPDNSEIAEGDRCELDNNQNGICIEATSCEYVKKLIDEKKYSEISRCQFKGRTPIVCCQQETLETSTIPVTTSSLPPPPKYPKSEKFKKALCKGEYEKEGVLELIKNIIGGETADMAEFPFQVALGYPHENGTIEYNCGGSLIADDIVLTATHCVNRKFAIPTTVKLGRVSLVPNEYDEGVGENIEIQSIIMHGNYSRWTNHNDIALIKLKHPTNFTWPIETICLSSDDKDLPKNFTITGYGQNDYNTKEKSTWLLKATVSIYSFEKCKNLIEKGSKKIVETQFCAIGYKGADSCKGDSGGPLSYTINGNPHLYGIVSYGIGCGGNFPGIYTKVNQFLEWIDDEMYKLEQN